MGMFDYVRCDWLPRTDPDNFHSRQDAPFQSKDFECNLDLYHITANGRLHKYSYATWEDEEERKGRKFVGDTNFNGTLDFYDGQEWRAQFLNGSLISIWKPADYWTPDYDDWTRAGEIQRESAKREAMLSAMTPEEREAWYAARNKELGEAMAAMVTRTIGGKGFMRRFLETLKEPS